MEVISEQEMGARLDFVKPMSPKPPERVSLWCIPFEYGNCPKGTKISIAKAREIAADLRAAVADAEREEMRRAFEVEKERTMDLIRRYADEQQRSAQLQGEANALRSALRAEKRRRGRGRRR